MRVSRRSFVRGAGLTLVAGLPALALARPQPRRVVVYVWLRGGADGLSLLVPYRDPAYYEARPTIAVPRRSVIALDGAVGLHPALAPLLPLWRSGQLTAVPAVGLPRPRAEHDAAGRDLAAAAPGLAAAARRPRFEPALGGAARAIRGGTSGPVVTVTLGGWDTHFVQGAVRGRLASRLAVLARGLAAFADVLGRDLGVVTLVAVTEFGRAAAEHRGGGTDHGHAAAALVLGGRSPGGRVRGAWPALHAAGGGAIAPAHDLRALVGDVQA